MKFKVPHLGESFDKHLAELAEKGQSESALEYAQAAGVLGGGALGAIGGALQKRHLKKTKQHDKRHDSPIATGILAGMGTGFLAGPVALAAWKPHYLLGGGKRTLEDIKARAARLPGFKPRKWIIPAATAAGAAWKGVKGYRTAKEDAKRLKERGRPLLMVPDATGTPRRVRVKSTSPAAAAFHGAMSGASWGLLGGTALQAHRFSRAAHLGQRLQLRGAPGMKPQGFLRHFLGPKEYIPKWAKGAKSKAEVRARFSKLVREVHADVAGQGKADTEAFSKLHDDWRHLQKTKHFEKLSQPIVHVPGAAGQAARRAGGRGAFWKTFRPRRLRVLASHKGLRYGAIGAGLGALGFLPIHSLEHGKLTKKEKRHRQIARGLSGAATLGTIGALIGGASHHLGRSDAEVVRDAMRQSRKAQRGFVVGQQPWKAAEEEHRLRSQLGDYFERAAKGAKKFFGGKRKISSPLFSELYNIFEECA